LEGGTPSALLSVGQGQESNMTTIDEPKSRFPTVMIVGALAFAVVVMLVLFRTGDHDEGTSDWDSQRSVPMTPTPTPTEPAPGQVPATP
jgi:hypothetical protein